jgi:hypothetical protein
MTFEEFQASKRHVDDLGKEINCDMGFDNPVPGFLYADSSLYIEKRHEGWHPMVKEEGQYYLLLGRMDWISDNLTDLERRLYEYAVREGIVDGVLEVLYTSDNESPIVMSIDVLIKNFDANRGWKYAHNEEDMRYELSSRGWYEGLHENGRYLVVNLVKMGLKKC